MRTVSSTQGEQSGENHPETVRIWGKNSQSRKKYKLSFKYKETSELPEFYVLSTQAPHVLALSSCLSLKLIKLTLSVEKIRKPEQTQSDVLSEYIDVFEGLGTFPGTHKIQLNQMQLPVIHPTRRVPVALDQ